MDLETGRRESPGFTPKRSLDERWWFRQYLYFTDVGLASFLLGIHTPGQASRDPLRGSLYENFIIAEILKGALNRGIRPEAYFFRLWMTA